MYTSEGAGVLARDWLRSSGARSRRHLQAAVRNKKQEWCVRTRFTSAFPVDITVGPAPQPFNAGEKTRLFYELHFTNFSASAIEILHLDVLGRGGSAPLASYDKDQLQKLLVLVGSDENCDADKVRAIGGGRSVIIFLDLALERDSATPTALHHRLLLSIPRKRDGTPRTPSSLPRSSAFRTGAFWRFQVHVTKLDNLQRTPQGWAGTLRPKV